MTPKTESVCKHCQKEIKNIAGTWYEASLMKKAIDAADAILAGACSVDGKLCRHEPVAEPASTLKEIDPELYERAANHVVKLHEPASTGEPPDYCQCGAIGLDSSGKCAVCRKPVPGAESDGFSAIIKCHTQEALDKLHDPEKLRMLIGASIDALMLQEEIDYTLEVRRDYK